MEAREVDRTFTIGASEIKVLRGVSLKVNRGEKLFLVGPSGAGKTSLLYTMAGLEAPNAGDVLVQGRSLYRLGRKEQARIRNTTMGYVFQSFFLLPELTALENVMLPAIIGGQQARERAVGLLEKVGLGARIAHLPTELSGGEQQRVAIARSLINNPTILFADEPTGNLDAESGRIVADLLFSIAKDRGSTLVIVTHDEDLAARAGRTVHMRDGHIV